MRSCLLLILFACGTAHAQDGTFDPTFNPADQGMARFDGVDESHIHCMLEQPDGKLLVGGWHDGGVLAIEDPLFRGGILRLNADGSPDAGFAIGTGFDGPVEVIILQADGKILVGGAFLNYNGTPRKGIARLNPNGTLDAGFTVGTGTGGTVYEIALQADGRILLGGNFTTYNALPAIRIVRLLSTGAIDPSFNAGSGFNGNVTALALQVDGKVLVGGWFTTFQGLPKNYLVRLNSNGSLDPVFNDNSVQSGPNNAVTDIAAGPGGTAYIAGVFTQFNGMLSNAVVKVDGNGAPVPVFDMAPSETPLAFHAEHVHYDQSTNVVTAWSYADLRKANGTTGATIYGWGAYGSWYSYLYCWSFSGVSKATVAPGGDMFVAIGNSILRLDPDLSHDGAFRPGSGLNSLPGEVTMALDDLGRPVIGSRDITWTTLTAFNGSFHPNLIGLTYDGAYDPSFPKKGHNSARIKHIEPYGMDTLLLTGFFSWICPDGGIGAPMVLMKISTGSITGVYVSGGGWDIPADEALRLPSGRTVYAGRGASLPFIGRFKSDVTADASYTITELSPDVPTDRLAAAPDGKVYVGGDFTTANGVVRNRIVRLLANGGVDPTFDPLVGFDARVRDMVVNPDGTIVCIGDFTTYRGAPAPHIAKLLPDATMDPAFDPGTGIANTPICMLRYPDGRILIGGAIPMYDGNVVNGVVCINADGSIDGTFDQGEGFRINNPTVNGGMYGGGTVVEMKMQPDGRVVCLGEFHMYDGNGRNRLARIGSGASMMVSARVFLEGAYNGSGAMDALIPRSMLPLAEPYRALGFTHVRGGSETTSAAVMQAQGPGAIIDWVLVELRDGSDSTLIVGTRSGLLRADGWIADVDGVSPLRFPGVGMGLYYVAVRHRNHLGIMSEAPYFFGSFGIPIDFTGPNYGTHGTNAQKEVQGVRMLWSGDVNHDGVLKYTGQNNDRDPILVTVGGTTPNATTTGYKLEDINLDGVVKYTGQDNDRDPILVNVGGTTPNNTRQAQLP